MRPFRRRVVALLAIGIAGVILMKVPRTPSPAPESPPVGHGAPTESPATTPEPKSEIPVTRADPSKLSTRLDEVPEITALRAKFLEGVPAAWRNRVEAKVAPASSRVWAIQLYLDDAPLTGTDARIVPNRDGWALSENARGPLPEQLTAFPNFSKATALAAVRTQIEREGFKLVRLEFDGKLWERDNETYIPALKILVDFEIAATRETKREAWILDARNYVTVSRRARNRL